VLRMFGRCFGYDLRSRHDFQFRYDLEPGFLDDTDADTTVVAVDDDNAAANNDETKR